MPSKTEKKKQNKVIEDKTFGLKNKNKSKTVQKYFTLNSDSSRESRTL